jgi:hypothetical protein
MMREISIKIKRRINGLGIFKKLVRCLTFKIYNSLQLSLLLYVIALKFLLIFCYIIFVAIEKHPVNRTLVQTTRDVVRL